MGRQCARPAQLSTCPKRSHLVKTRTPCHRFTPLQPPFSSLKPLCCSFINSLTHKQHGRHRRPELHVCRCSCQRCRGGWVCGIQVCLQEGGAATAGERRCPGSRTPDRFGPSLGNWGRQRRAPWGPAHPPCKCKQRAPAGRSSHGNRPPLPPCPVCPAELQGPRPGGAEGKAAHLEEGRCMSALPHQPHPRANPS